MIRCSHCGLEIFVVEKFGPPHCRWCKAPLCPYEARDCGYQHWRIRHSNAPRKVVEVKPL